MIAVAACKNDFQRGDENGKKWFRLSLLVVATLLLANITLLLGIHSGLWDAANLFCPFQMLLADYARHGEFLLWTPLLNAGYPVGIDPQMGAFSPISVGLGLLTGGYEFGFRAYWLIIWGIGGTGIVVLARHLSAPPWAAYIAAVGFMFSGIYTGHAEHTCILTVISFLPWILWRLDAAIVDRSLSAAAQAGALFGLSALAGYPGMVIISGCFACLWLVGGIWLRVDSLYALAFDKLRLTFVTAVVFLAVSVVVMSPAYLGYIVETRGYSYRADALPRDIAVNNNALHPAATATFAGPFLSTVAISNQEELYPGTDISTCSIYIFPLLVVLAAASLWQKPRDGFRLCLAVLGLLCLLCAMGSAIPLRGWLYDWFAPMRYFRHSGIFRCYYVFALVVLALLGSRDLKEAFSGENQIWKNLAIFCCMAASMAVGVFIWICVRHASLLSMYYFIYGIIHLVLIWLGTSVAMLIGWKSNNWKLREGILRRYIAGLVIADAVLSVIICTPMMYTGRSAAWSGVEAKHVGSIDLLDEGLQRQLNPDPGCLNNNLPQKKAVFCSYISLINNFHVETGKNPLLADIALGKDRIWFARQAAEVPLTEESFRQYAQDAGKKGGPCLVISNLPGMSFKDITTSSAYTDLASDGALEDILPLEPLKTKLLKYCSRELIFDIVCPDKGWVLVTDRWAAGWSATINGRKQPIAIGNYIFRAVEVEKGLNRINFQYCPFGYPWLLIASWATMGIIFSLPVVAIARSKCSASRGDNLNPIILEAEIIETPIHKRKSVRTMHPIKGHQATQ
jgi:hypothetical protein